MNKQKFIDTYVNKMIENDEKIRKCFEMAGTEEEKTLLRKGLEQSLDTAYQKYAQEYYESGKTGKCISKILRAGAFGANLAGTYLFWAGGGAGFGIGKGMGALANLAAEYIENKHYEKTKKTDSRLEKIISKDGLMIAGEAAGQNLISYLPVGGEIWGFLRGTKKYDEKVAKRAIYHAKNEFMKRFGEQKEMPETAQIVPISEFMDPRYKQAA
ncbi:hypothetical protein KY309_02185 [Candidatus Woesearchaeota archaeon]|nr:hypothetical protein [Candidatus Woesearchaeota archaeon]MBW3016395.1 hypothetical protein [Candidatus Woesearchaeota archaeon]